MTEYETLTQNDKEEIMKKNEEASIVLSIKADSDNLFYEWSEDPSDEMIVAAQEFVYKLDSINKELFNKKL